MAELNSVPLLSANVTDNNGTVLRGVSDCLILKRGGKRLMIVGLSTYYGSGMRPDAYNLFIEMGNIRTADPLEALESLLNAHADEYDYTIALSHSGHDVDTVLKEKLLQVDLWLGGHSHRVITESNYSQSGKGENLGCVTLEIDNEKIAVVDSIQNAPEEQSVVFEKLLRTAEIYADGILSAELDVVEELEFDPFRESALINSICDGLHKRFGGDLAIMHSGIAEKALTRPVSRKTLVETFPSKLNPTIYQLTGEKILEAAQLSLDEDHIKQSGKGGGFRGNVMGCLCYSANVRLKKEPFAMWMNGKQIAREEKYTIVADDNLQRGTGYPSLAVSNEAASFDKWVIRDLVQHCLMNVEVLQKAKNRRFSA